jgi:hypothetical protein
MRKYLRLAAGVSCLGVLILGAVALDPDGPLLSAFQGCTAKRAALLEELEREGQLDQGKHDFYRHREAKRHVAEEVIARRCSLAEAMEAFRTLEEQRLPDRVKQHALQRQKMSEDEWLGQGVLDYVQQVLADRPGEAAEVAGRLEKEFQQLLAKRKKRHPAPVDPPTKRCR